MPELLSQSIAIGLSIAVVIGMVGILNFVREGNQTGMAQAMAENVCSRLKLATEGLSQSGFPSRTQISLPSKIGGEAYLVTSAAHMLNVTSSSASTGCVAGSPFEISGSAAGGNVVLTFSENKIKLSGA